ncbi:MAG TPA: catalase [Candidatus Sulfotelmatobacter sp.]|nr:catalase [Candidatus Sulfotelmatobacter sp.]
MTEKPSRITTTDAGIPAASDEHSLTAGPNGPILLQDHYLIQKMAQFNRERVPERVVHAKGGGAHGFFEVTEDVTPWCKADFLSKKGLRTPVLARFSTVAQEAGSADTVRDPRGFALKFYTQEGNYDLVGNNTPIFFIRDPQKFQDFIHSQKRRADTHLRDNNMQWDFWTLSPESAHQVTFLMTDRGIPRTWRHMNGYGSHTFLWENAGGEKFWVKYHFKTAQGIENLTDSEAKTMAADDKDYHLRDLHSSIAKGDAPEWRLEMQIMPFHDAADYRFNPFDLTKVWPHNDYPTIPIGRLVLNLNPENYFAEIEQASFEPANMVSGIGPSPDKMLQGRLFSYPDTHRHRIGTNYLELPVNRPVSPVHSYNRDGAMRHFNPPDPVYAPNSYGGPKADPAYELPSWQIEAGEIARTAYMKHADDNDFVQPAILYRDVLSDVERDHLVTNVVGHLHDGVKPEMQGRAVQYWTQVDATLGARIRTALEGDRGALKADAASAAEVHRARS